MAQNISLTNKQHIIMVDGISKKENVIIAWPNEFPFLLFSLAKNKNKKDSNSKTQSKLGVNKVLHHWHGWHDNLLFDSFFVFEHLHLNWGLNLSDKH